MMSLATFCFPVGYQSSFELWLVVCDICICAVFLKVEASGQNQTILLHKYVSSMTSHHICI